MGAVSNRSGDWILPTEGDPEQRICLPPTLPLVERRQVTIRLLKVLGTLAGEGLLYRRVLGTCRGPYPVGPDPVYAVSQFRRRRTWVLMYWLQPQSRNRKRVIDMGVVDDTKGKAKEAVGDATGNDKLKGEGKVDQAKGKVKDAVDKVADKATGK